MSIIHITEKTITVPAKNYILSAVHIYNEERMEVLLEEINAENQVIGGTSMVLSVEYATYRNLSNDEILAQLVKEGKVEGVVQDIEKKENV